MFCSSLTRAAAGKLLLFTATIAVPASSQQTCEAPRELQGRVAAKPADAAANELGAWFAQKGNLTCAIRSFESALRANPDSLDSRYNLGLALSEAGNSGHVLYVNFRYLSGASPMSRVHTALAVALR